MTLATGGLISKDRPMTRFNLAFAASRVRQLLLGLGRLRPRSGRFEDRERLKASRIVALDPIGELDRPPAVIDAAIVTALANMPARARQVFILSRVEGLTYREIAGDLRIPRCMVRRAMRRAIADLYAAVLEAEANRPA